MFVPLRVSQLGDCYTLRIQVCPKEGIGPATFLFFSDGIGTLNTILGSGLDS